MFHSLKTRFVASREEGFTLTEIAVALVVFGVLAAIALPVYLNAQKGVSALDVKTGLVQAASLIDAEKTDNNQLYPVYMPNEVLANKLWKTFAYTYSDNRFVYCLQGKDGSGAMWYVSSTDLTPTSANCGQANPGRNSALPWTVEFAKIDVTNYGLRWASGASKPEVADSGSIKGLTWTTTGCSDGGTASYQLHLSDTSQGVDLKIPSDNQVLANNSGLTTNSYTPDLAGWLPGDQTKAEVAQVCTYSTGGRLYTYTGSFNGLSKTATVPQFPLASASFASAPAAYYEENTDKSLTLKLKATFTALSCPTLAGGITGVNKPVYELIAEQNAPKVIVGLNTYSDNPAVVMTLTGLAPDTAVTYTGRAYCQFTRAAGGAVARYSGTDHNGTQPEDRTTFDNGTASQDGRAVVSSVYTPVGFPTASGTPTTVSTNGNDVKPDGLAWTAPPVRACTYGGTAQYSYVQQSPGAAASDYVPNSLASGLIKWAQATSYKYVVNVRCVGVHGFISAYATSAPVQFTTSAITPSTSWQRQYTTAYASDNSLDGVNGTIGAVTCVKPATAVYDIKATQGSRSYTSPRSTDQSPTLQLDGFVGDQLVTFTGTAYCRVAQWDGSIKDYPSAQITSTEYAAVAKPNGTSTPGTFVTGDPDVIANGLSWNGQGCPNGGSIQYQYVQSYPGNAASGWTTATSVANIGWTAGSTYRYYINYRCVGTYRVSDTISGGTVQFSTQFNTPHAPSAPSGIWTDQYGYSGITTPNRVLWYSVGCDRGGTAQYLLREVRVGGNYNGNGYNQTDWMTNTTVFSVPDSWLRQGSQIGYQVIARCYNNAGISGNGNWSGERNDITGISQPSAVGVNRINDRAVNWGSVGCGQGAYAQYYFQEFYHNDGQWSSVEGGWGQYNSATNDSYNGYQWGDRIYTRCVGDNAISNQSQGEGYYYRVPVYNPNIYLVCKPGTQNPSSHGSDDAQSFCRGGPAPGHRIAFTRQCSETNPYWNGQADTASGWGIEIAQASGLSSTQISDNSRQGSNKAGANGKASDNYSGGYSWGGNYSVNFRGNRCVAGNGYASNNWTGAYRDDYNYNRDSGY